MAGSYEHCCNDDGSFRFDLIENMGDAYEACEDMHARIADLERHLAEAQEHGRDQCARADDLEQEVERLKEQLTAATAIPNDAQIRKWEAFAKAKISVLNRLAEAIIQDEPASSGWLRQQCGLSADEWHGAGELIAALICFGCDKGFLDWHAAGMADIDMPDQIEAARREGAREATERAAQTVENPLALLLPPKDVAAAIRTLAEGEESDGE